MKTFSIGLLLFSLNGVHVNAQSFNYSDKQELLQAQLNKLSLIHDSIFDSQDYLLNGTLYYTIGNEYNHPFFIDNTWQPGKIWSSGNVYNSKTVRYDINSDYLVYLHYRNSYAYPIHLNKETVNEFMISGHYFRYLEDFEKSSKGELKPGYYEVLYDGVTKFYIRWEKSNKGVADQTYSQRILFFIKKEGKYFRVRGKTSLVNALNDHKKEIRTFMKKNNINFSINKYDSIVKVFEYYDNL